MFGTSSREILSRCCRRACSSSFSGTEHLCSSDCVGLARRIDAVHILKMFSLLP
ncbi:hypothetical protein IscW_ISCW000863 [Ixodes scapularis]|uniref:Uncharacterized protein n=1 Tax=Ixodes scapularis TaxID=6945 RepID=B7P2K2_IXOSC|nr:hypothetical protein IscW_ISCW000863 [Ixodes scapularis]|eukprot:XP_002402462.1 hypothetical protein IscW_ISCW000863 [Ixodes scapularis]